MNDDDRPRRADDLLPANWDDSQLAVIGAEPDARLLISAGPGTGKTAVACRRISQLIDVYGSNPAGIWLISFTRTAVREIQLRIGAYLNDPASLSSVRIATIDSHAWAIHSGFSELATLAGTYEENIEKVTRLVTSHEGVFEYLEGVEHLIIDEAQDIVGPRVDLILALLGKLRPQCGVTIFADEAQAIYGFADDNGTSTEITDYLPDRLRQLSDYEFLELSLSRIHRTSSDNLKRLYVDGRKMVLSSRKGVTDAKRYADVAQLIETSADNRMSVDDFLATAMTDDTFLLFRRRVEALMASSFMLLRPRRLRMSGLPICMEPWVGVLFWDFIKRRFTFDDFQHRWHERIGSQMLGQPDSALAWQQLVQVAGESATSLSMPLLRGKLARRAPPTQFCRPDFGLAGPVFGTIHGCKGREASNVLLMLPMESDAKHHQNANEEARIMFVGATRAKQRLTVVSPFAQSLGTQLESGRAFVCRRGESAPRLQLEFGRDGDLQPDSVVGRKLFSLEGAHEGQLSILRNASTMQETIALASEDVDYRYRIFALDGTCIGVFSERLNEEIWEATFAAGRFFQRAAFKPPAKFRHVRVFGARTLVASPDMDRLSLHEPWATSGFMLAPLAQGFDTGILGYRRSQS